MQEIEDDTIRDDVLKEIIFSSQTGYDKASNMVGDVGIPMSPLRWERGFINWISIPNCMRRKKRLRLFKPCYS